MDIFTKIRELDLDSGSYVVVGGGTLVGLGILEWDDDIDLCVSQHVFDEFKSDGWRTEDWNGKTVLKRDIYDVGVNFGEWTLEELLQDTMVINDIPFMSLDKLLTWKRHIARPKDVEHIALIENYLLGLQK